MKKLILFYTFSVSVLAGWSQSAQKIVRTIEVDAGKVQGPLNRTFNQCVGAGRANEGLRADWQQQLTYVKKECGFQYIRMHGLLTDDMGVYSEDKNGKPQFNFMYVDVLF